MATDVMSVAFVSYTKSHVFVDKTHFACIIVYNHTKIHIGD